MMRNLLILIAIPFLSHQSSWSETPDTITRIAFGSCIRESNPTPILKTVLAKNPDRFLFIGDNIYADTSDRMVMRKKYETLAGHETFRALRAAVPCLATWDDHDFGVNDGGASFPKRKMAEEEFVKFWNIPSDAPLAQRPGVYSQQRIQIDDRVVQIILLDTRYFRSDLKKGETRRVGGPYVSDPNPQKTMLGDDQWKWLETQFKKPADVRLIVSSIQFIAESSGQETWSNLPLQRNFMFELIRQTETSGVIFLSGDRHWAELSAADDAGYRTYDLTSSSLNQIHQRGTPTENQFRISKTTYHKENFGVVAIDWEKDDPEISLSIHDIDGKSILGKQINLSELQFEKQ